MKFDVLTLFPEMIDAACSYSILKRAKEQNVVEINAINPRDYTENKHRKVDDTPYGGGFGMVLAPQPVFDAYASVQKNKDYLPILLTPQGKTYNQKIAEDFSKHSQLILICGHYEGFDERIRTELDDKLIEISIGDFVMTGGELAALTIIDSVTRLLDGALGHDESSLGDTFSDGLLEYPQYTKPADFRGSCVPEVLLNGNHAQINKWRRVQQILKTKEKRPDLYEKFLQSDLSKEDLKIISSIS